MRTRIHHHKNMVGYMTDSIELTLPYPPSVNHYWRSRIARTRGGKSYIQTYLSAEAKAYKVAVVAVVRETVGAIRLQGELSFEAVLHPPDKRVRDLDNINKSLWDALKEAKLFEDDSQIREMHTKFGPPIPGGRAVVRVGVRSEGGLAT